MLKNKNIVIQIKEEQSEDSDDGIESDHSYTQISPLIATNEKDDSTLRRRTFNFYRGVSEDSHNRIESNVLPEYSVDLRFKKAIEGNTSYFQYWFNQIKLDATTTAVRKFKEDEEKGARFSILHYAAQHYRAEICEKLINQFTFDPNTKTRKGVTPLHVLVKFNSRLRTINSVQDFSCDFPSGSPTVKRRSRAYTNTNKDITSTMDVLIKYSADVNSQDENGFTPLHYAAMKDNFIAAEKIVDIANIHLKDKQNMTAFHVACKYGSEQVFNMLLDRIDANMLATDVDIKEALPLHHACSCKVEKVAMVDKMLEKLQSYDHYKRTQLLRKALEQPNCRKKTILHICIENNHSKLVELLCLKYNADVNQRGGGIDNYPIHMCAKVGSEKILNVLESKNAMPYVFNRKGENLLHIAACADQDKFIAKFLSNERAKQLNNNSTARNFNIPAVHATNMRQQTPLLLAALYGNTNCVDVLLKQGKANIEDKDFDDNTIFHLCALHDNLQIFKYLLNPNSCFLTKQNFLPILKQADRYDNTVVHIACKYGHIDILKFIFSSELFDESMGELLFAKNNNEQTGFQIACAKGHLNIVHYFLNMKNINTSGLIQDVDENFNTGLHLASISGHHRIVSLLIKHGASIEARNNEDYSALDIACHHGWYKVTSVLLQNDALIYSPGTKIHPLLLASSNGKHEVVHLLLNHNAKISTTNDSNQNCLDLALENGHKEVVRTILNSENWIEVIHLNRNGSQYDSLINNMPDMMEVLLNKIEENKEKSKEYDFSAIDLDFDSIYDHPLMIMAESKQESLLKNPVTQKLIELKWKRFPQYVYLINLALYFFFIILLSLHVIMSKKNYVYNATDTSNSSVGQQYNILVQNFTVYVLTFILLIIHLVKELCQLINDRLAYFNRLDNILELSTYTLTLIFMLPISIVIRNDLGHSNDHFQLSKGQISFHRFDWQWQLGSICILLAWIVFVFFIEKFKLFGKYVVMFHRILLNSLQFFPVFSLFIFGFALSFSMLLGNEDNDFGQFSTAIMKTISMMIGELEFKDVFTEKSWANYIVYALFISFMCIIIFNLLVGLAVGDINKVETDAYVELMFMKIEFLLQIQKSFRGKIGFKKSFMQYETVSEEDFSKMDILEKIVQKFLNILYTLFNKSASYTKKTKANDAVQDTTLKAIQDLQVTMANNFNNMNIVVSKMRNEIKLIKGQMKNYRALMMDFKKSASRQRYISS